MKGKKNFLALFVLAALLGVSCDRDRDGAPIALAQVSDDTTGTATAVTPTETVYVNGREAKYENGKFVVEYTLQDLLDIERQKGRDEARDSIQKLLVSNAFLSGKVEGLEFCCGCGGSKTRTATGNAYRKGEVIPQPAPTTPPFVITVSPVMTQNNGGLSPATPAAPGTTEQQTVAPTPPPAPQTQDSVAPKPITQRSLRGDLGMITVPQKEIAFVNMGVQIPVGEKLTVRGGVSAGYQRFGQTHSVMPGDRVDVQTSTRTMVGPYAGVSYEVLKGLNLDGILNVWGVKKDKASLFLGASGELPFLPGIKGGIGYNVADEKARGFAIRVSN